MLLFLLFAYALLTGSAVAKYCQNFLVPVNINARNGVFNLPTFKSNLDAVTFTQVINNIKGNFTTQYLQGYQTVTGEYNISVQFCQPEKRAGSTVQFLTHGIGFDKTYWDLSFQNLTDSYVDVAVDQYGYSTFAIDRFGIGKSSVADPLSIVQAPAALSAIHELTTMLRQGKVTNIPHAFSKIIHVGHSFGSILGVNLAAMYPTDSDALILTGFAPNSSFVGTTLANWNFKLARLSQPFRFGNANPARATKAAIENFGGSLEAMGVPLADVKPMLQTTELGNLMAGIEPSDTPHMQDLPCGYLTWTDAGCNQFSFLYPGFFDQDTLQWSEANKFPVTVGEVLTLGGGAQGAPEFRGPVMVFTGAQDSIFCSGDCYATGNPKLASIPAITKLGFPAAKAFEAYLQPNTGHALNLHHNATTGYKVIQDFLRAQGLGAK